MFLPTAEGYVSAVYPNDNTGGNPPKYAYVSSLRDHLGNLRLSITRENNRPTVLQERHYYPFGMLHAGYGKPARELYYDTKNRKIYSRQTATGRYKYWYNGKEWQDDAGLDMYDYGARQYDPAVGRWFTMDPKAEKFPQWSAYVYTYDNPIKFLDPTGMEGENVHPPDEWIKFSNGEIVKVGDKGGDKIQYVTEVQENGELKQYELYGDQSRINELKNEQSKTPGKTVEKALFVANVAGMGEKITSQLKHGGGYIAFSRAKSGKGLYWKPNARGLNKLKGFSINVSKGLKIIGVTAFFGGIMYDRNNYKKGKISGSKFLLNTSVGAYGLTTYGVPASTIYFGLETFYPGGFPAAMHDYGNGVKNYNEFFKGTGAHYRTGGGL